MADERINLKGLDRADVLAVLYNASRPQGMGFMQYDATPMTREEAQELLDTGHTYFDYLKGRVMKIDLSRDELDAGGYDIDNGRGAAENAISFLRFTQKVNSDSIRDLHRSSTQDAARHVKGKLHERTCYDEGGGIVGIRLGLNDVAEPLNKKVDEALRKLNESK